MSNSLHCYSCSHADKSFSFSLILIEAVGQLPETLFGRVGERLLDVGPAAFGKTE